MDVPVGPTSERRFTREIRAGMKDVLALICGHNSNLGVVDVPILAQGIEEDPPV